MLLDWLIGMIYNILASNYSVKSVFKFFFVIFFGYHWSFYKSYL